MMKANRPDRTRKKRGILGEISVFLLTVTVFSLVAEPLTASAVWEADDGVAIVDFEDERGTEFFVCPNAICFDQGTEESDYCEAGSNIRIPESKKRRYDPLYTDADAIALAQMAHGEALVTGSDTEMAAVMWCALNRFDSGDPYYRNCKSIEAIVKQPYAFSGYSPNNPVDEHLLWLAYDVLERWNSEQYGNEDVGRVLPAEYLFFHGDGMHNHFRTDYESNGQFYDWSLESPYES